VIGPGRAELAAAVRSAPVVMALVLGQDRPQVPFAEDEHPVGELCPGGEHEPFRVSVRTRAAGRDLHGLDPGTGQDRVECVSELPGTPGAAIMYHMAGSCTFTGSGPCSGLDLSALLIRGFGEHRFGLSDAEHAEAIRRVACNAELDGAGWEAGQ
jgi:hypothetical protein